MPSTLVIYNPAAGSGRVREQWNDVENALRAAGVDFISVATAAPLEATTLAREAAQKYAAVVSVGGDGTLHEIVNGLLQASKEAETIPLGFIPLGNGDDFAKVIPPETPIGGKPFSWQTAVQKIARGETRLYDAGRVTINQPQPESGQSPHYFINSLDVGFGAQAILNLNSVPRFLKGFPAYLAAVFKTLIDYPVLHLRIQIDDQAPFEQATVMAAITNGRCFGSSFWVCPEGRADDGFFDVTLAQNLSRTAILKLIPKLMKGTHMQEPVLSMHQARRVVLESTNPLIVEADGEIPYREAQRIEVDILSKKVCMMI
jgi:diacylglycerol kinase (ATP)